MTKSENPRYSPLLEPFEYQAVAIRRMAECNAPNFDEQGLGKTKQAYDTGAHLIARNDIDLILFIGRASLRENLRREIVSDGKQLCVRVVRGTERQRHSIYNSLSCHVLIVSYETAVADLKVLTTLLSKYRTLICIDESHNIRNVRSKRSQACLHLCDRAAKTLIFSGTPAPNKTDDLYPQLKSMGLDVGHSLAEFRTKFSEVSDLRDFLLANSIRRTKSSIPTLQLPEKRVQRVSVPLIGTQASLYARANEELIVELESRFGERESIPLTNVLVKLLRLVQLASNPRLLSSSFLGEPAKFLALDKLVETELIEKNRKIIIWTSFRGNVDELAIRYAQHKPLKLYGGIGTHEKKRLLNEFQNRDEHKVIIAIPACGREGFTFTRASTAIYVDRGFSFVDWAQSQDRIHRISQRTECNVYVLEGAATVDLKVDDILNRKAALQSYLLGEIETYKDPQSVSMDEALGFLRKKPG